MKALFAAGILLSIILGILFAPFFDIQSVSLIALFGVFFIVSMTVIPEKWLWISILTIGFFFLGVFRYHQFDLAFKNSKFEDGKMVKVTGQITEPPEEGKKSTKIILKDSNSEAKIMLVLKPFSSLKFGDEVQAEGKVTLPQDESLKNSLKAKGITGQMSFPLVEKLKSKTSLTIQEKSFLFAIRDRFEESINTILPEPESPFLAGLILGTKRNLPDWLVNDLKRSGTTHLIALSGFNITVIIEGLRIIFSRRSARMSFYAPLAAILAFVVMTGAGASVVRAGIMGAMMLLAKRVGRQSSAAMAVIITAAVMVIVNPYILRLDVGFQLSFGAFLGIIYLAPIIRSLLPKPESFLKDLFAATLGAQIMAYPILLYYFGSFSVVAIAANLLILPFIPTIMLLGFLSALGGMVWVNLGNTLSWTVFSPLRIIITLIHFLASLPFASLDGMNISWLNIFLIYALVGEVIFIYGRVKRRRRLS